MCSMRPPYLFQVQRDGKRGTGAGWEGGGGGGTQTCQAMARDAADEDGGAVPLPAAATSVATCELKSPHPSDHNAVRNIKQEAASALDKYIWM